MLYIFLSIFRMKSESVVTSWLGLVYDAVGANRWQAGLYPIYTVFDSTYHSPTSGSYHVAFSRLVASNQGYWESVSKLAQISYFCQKKISEDWINSKIHTVFIIFFMFPYIHYTNMYNKLKRIFGKLFLFTIAFLLVSRDTV